MLLFGCEHCQIVSQLSSYDIKILDDVCGDPVRGQSSEAVEAMSRRKVDFCGLQEVRWRGESARFVEGKDSRCKMFRVENDKNMGAIVILLAEKWVEAVFDVKHVSDRIMFIKLGVCEDFNGHTRKNADGMRELMGAEDLEDVIWRMREFLNLLWPTTLLFQIHFSQKGRVTRKPITLVKIEVKLITSWLRIQT